MTHDELLAKLSNDENGYAGSTSWQRVNALRAVVELHSPYECIDGCCLFCTECDEDSAVEIPYPCPTIRAIEKELA